MMPRGFWELCVQTGGVDRKFLVLQPDYVNLAGGGVIQIEWTIKRGLAVSHFSPKDPPTGGDGEYEEEKHSQNWPGMPVINLPGFHVRPGRDGWKTIGALLQTPQSMYKPNALHAYWSLKAFRETNPDQFVATSYNWDVMHR
jgi:hypothetical protein